MKIFRRLILGIFAMVVALGVATAAIIMSTDAQQVSGFIADRVKTATGRDLFIDGDIAMKLSWVPTVSASDVRFSNASWGSRADMIRLKRIEVGLDLVPLLRGEIRLSRLLLVEPDILLERRSNGDANWHLKVAKPSSEIEREVETKLEEYGGLPILTVLSLERGTLAFLDEQRKYRRDISIQRVDLATESAEDRVQIDAAFTADEEIYTVGGSISSLYRLLTDPRFFNIDVVGTALGSSIDVRGVIQAPLSRRLIDAKVSINATDSADTIRRVAKLFGLNQLTSVPLNGELDANFRVTGAPENLAVENIEAVAGRASGFQVSASGSIKSLLTQPTWVANVEVAVPNPSVLSDMAGRALPTKPAVKAGAQFSNGRRSILIDNGTLLVGETKMAGNFRLDRSQMPMAISGAVQAEKIRLGDLRPFFGEATPVKPTQKPALLLPDNPLPLNNLPDIDASIKFVAGELDLDGFKISDTALSFSKQAGEVDLTIAKAGVVGGRLSGRAGLNADADLPGLAVDMKYQGGNVDQLVAYLTDIHLLDGAIDADIRVDSKGSTVRQLAAELNGQVEIVMDQGRVADRYVELLAADVLAELMPWADKTKEARINCFVTRFDIKQGIATNTGLLFDTDKLAVTGSGTIDLKFERLDLRLNPKPKEAKLVSLGIPINITGTFTDPKAAPTAGAVVKGVAGLALGLVNPLALLLAVADKGDSRNNCTAALDAARLGPVQDQGTSQSVAPVPQPKPNRKPSSPVGKVIDGVEKGIEGVGRGIGRAIEGILGGGK